uniref:Uncharacterized protein n=1 Tax=Bursaphelenchus xylophilus TaxID=6326 RepID=A0A1I7RKJ6_BURXY
MQSAPLHEQHVVYYCYVRCILSFKFFDDFQHCGGDEELISIVGGGNGSIPPAFEGWDMILVSAISSGLLHRPKENV